MSTPSAPRPRTGRDVYIRRRPVHERVITLPMVAVSGLINTLLLIQVVGVLTAAEPADSLDPAAVLPLLVIGLSLAVPGVIAYRPRLVADATGLHVRGILSRHDLPWPASRGELVVVPVFGLSRASMTAVQYRPADGSRPVTIYALARSVPGWSWIPSAHQEASDLWDWGQRRGYAGRVPSPAAGAGAGAGAGAAPTRPAAADPATLTQEALHLSSWRSSRRVLVGLLSVLALVLAGAVITLLNPRNDADPVRAIVGILFFGTLTIIVVVLARSRTRIDVEGFHVRGLRRVDAPWPRSRSDLFVQVVSTGRKGSDGTCVLLLPDASALLLPGAHGGGGEGGALRAWELSESIWAWGVAHGVARDDGGYRPCANPAWEERRQLSQEYLAAERARLSKHG